MLPPVFAMFGSGVSTTWAPVGAGAVVTALVIGSAVFYERWRRRPARASREEDLPYQYLLGLLEEHNRNRAKVGLPPEQPTNEVLDQLMAKLPDLPDPTWELPEDREFLALGGSERRTGRRRWGNPTEVHLHSSPWYFPRHGLVVNRSTGGLGLYTDKEVAPGTSLEVRPVEAPAEVPAIRVEVRHCRPCGKGFIIGCQFTEDRLKPITPSPGTSGSSGFPRKG